jgi:hypothetical protein
LRPSTRHQFLEVLERLEQLRGNSAPKQDIERDISRRCHNALEILASRRFKQIVQRHAPIECVLERQRQPKIHPRREMRQAEKNFTPL